MLQYHNLYYAFKEDHRNITHYQNKIYNSMKVKILVITTFHLSEIK